MLCAVPISSSTSKTRTRGPDVFYDGKRLPFADGEQLRTEISAKFTLERVQRDLTSAGLELVRWLTDAEERFALVLAKPSLALA